MPWTIGEAGLVWDSAEPQLIAASVARIARDRDLRENLRERGRARYASTFAPDVLSMGLQRIMERFAR
jgi:glycosyltransferase involved in cell wall biosynthesis